MRRIRKSTPQPAAFQPVERRYYEALHVLTLVVAAGILAVPGTVVQIIGMGYLAAPVLAVLWGYLAIRAGRARRENPRVARDVMHLAVAPVVIAAAFLLAQAHYPYALALRLSRSGMDQVARQVLAAPARAPLPERCRLGLFLTTAVDRCGAGVRFHVRYGQWLDDTGFAYSPTSLAGFPEGYTYREIGDGWYEFNR